MLKRYRAYMQASPLQGWVLSVVILLAFSRALTWLRPDAAKHGPSSFLLLGCLAFSQPTVHLMMRLSEEGRRERPISIPQERGIGRLSLASSLCSLGALGIAAVGRWQDWPLDTRVAWLSASFIAAAVSAALGYGVRQSRAGRWGMGLSATWGLLLVVYVLVMLFLHASGHA